MHKECTKNGCLIFVKNSARDLPVSGVLMLIFVLASVLLFLFGIFRTPRWCRCLTTLISSSGARQSTHAWVRIVAGNFHAQYRCAPGTTELAQHICVVPFRPTSPSFADIFIRVKHSSCTSSRTHYRVDFSCREYKMLSADTTVFFSRFRRCQQTCPHTFSVGANYYKSGFHVRI